MATYNNYREHVAYTICRKHFYNIYKNHVQPVY